VEVLSSTVTQSPQPSQTSFREILQAALFLGTYTCGLLGVPFALQPVLIGMIPVSETVQDNLDTRRLVRSEHSILEALAFELHLELFGILSSNGVSKADARTTALGRPIPLHYGRGATMITMYAAEKQLEWWLLRFLRVFPQGEVTARIAR